MELPLAPQQHEPAPEVLVRAVKRRRVVLARTMAEETDLPGATAFTSVSRPGVRSANFAADLTLDEGTTPAELLDRLAAHFAARHLPCHALDSASLTWPAPLAAALAERGWRPANRRVLRLRRYQPPQRQNPDLQILPARSLYGELAGFYRHMARLEHQADEPLARQFAAAMIDRLDEPRLDLFLGRRAGKTVASAGVLILGDTGVIEPAWTDPAWRGQAVATTLMASLLEHCARSQLEHVLIERGEDCPSLPFYERLGFAEVARFVRYRQPAKPEGLREGRLAPEP